MEAITIKAIAGEIEITPANDVIGICITEGGLILGTTMTKAQVRELIAKLSDSLVYGDAPNKSAPLKPSFSFSDDRQGMPPPMRYRAILAELAHASSRVATILQHNVETLHFDAMRTHLANVNSHVEALLNDRWHLRMLSDKTRC